MSRLKKKEDNFSFKRQKRRKFANPLERKEEEERE